MAEIRRTTCNRDCPDACSVLVTVEDGRALRLRGDPDDPVTRGFLCQRTHRFLARQYAADRFTAPMLRRGGELAEVSWDEALGLAAEKLQRFHRESGPASILHYRSGGSLGMLKAAASRLFELFGPVTVKRGDICSGAGDEAQLRDFGISESHDVFDLLNSRLIVLWGKNVPTSSVHLLPVLLEARKRGAVIVGIDPVRTRSAKFCDHFFQPRPGADYAVVMGMVRWIFENDAADHEAPSYCDHLDAFRALAFARSFGEWAAEADLEPAELEELARLYATTGPANIQIGWGMGRRRNGCRTIRAVDGLAAISGNLGIAGGGASFYYARRAAFDLDFVRDLEVAPRSLAEARLGEEILAAREPPIRMIWVTAGNPLSMLPDSGTVRRAFERTEFVVVVDTHPTDTTDQADLVLPTLTLLEDEDLLGAYGNHFIRASQPAVEPPGTARHELWIIQELARRLGLGAPMAGKVEDWKRRVTGRLEAAGVTLERLSQGPVRNPFAARVLFEGRRFPTPSGRVNLLADPADLPPRGGEDHPLTLMAVAVPEAQSSQWSVPIPPGAIAARVHPESAGAVADGGAAILESRRARLPVRVVHDPALRRDVVLLAKGGMMRDGRCGNLLIEAVETDHGGGAAYYDEPVRLVVLEGR